MFKLNNLYNNAPLEIEISHNGVTIIFNISTIVNKRNKDEIDSAKQFTLLHDYLDYKGDGFKTALMNEYIKAEEVLFDNIGRVEIMPLPNELVNGILDMFPIEDMYHYIINVKKYPALRVLKDKFDEKIVKDSLGTRVQTYIKQDYLELVSLVQVLKTVVGPIGQFSFMNSAELGKSFNHYTLFNFITQHRVSESEPFKKLHGLVSMVFATLSKSEDETSIRVIEKKLPSDEMVVWVLSIVMIQKIAMSTIVDDTDTKHVVTRAYNFVINKLKVKGDTSNAVRSKRPMVDSESDGEGESILESYRITSEFSKGFVVEMEWALDSLINNPLQLDEKIDLNVLADSRIMVNRLANSSLSRVQIVILGWIFKSITDPRSLLYVKLETILGLLSLAFAYLWCNNFKYLALLMTSMQAEVDDAVIISFTSNRSRITKELKDELDKIYPYKKVIVTTGAANREVNISDLAVNSAADEIYKQRWVFMASREYIIEATGNASPTINVPSDLKIKLAELIIHINK